MTFLKKGNGTREVAAEPGAMMKATGRIGVDMIPVMAVSLAVVIGDLIAIPFVDILKRTSDASHDSGQSNVNGQVKMDINGHQNSPQIGA